MIEEYRPVKGYEGLYEVSNFGNVKSLERTDLIGRRLKEKILKSANSINRRYKSVVLFKEGFSMCYNVHQLVAIAFLNHSPNGLKIVVDHIDNNQLNNRLDNLQLVTQRENMSKDRKLGTSKYPGVSWNKQANKWTSSISINGKKKHLGLFTNEIQAANYYQYELQRL